MSQQFSIYCGVDVSKEWIDVYVDGKHIRLNQKRSEIKSFIKKQLKKPSVTLAVLESTGGYELLAAECFDESGITVHIAHPNRVKDFAKAKGRLAKTDQLDAATLSEYGAFIEPSAIRPLRSKIMLKLHMLNSRIVQLKAMRHQESCRLGTAKIPEVRQTHKAMLKLITKQIDGIEKEMLSIIKSDEELYVIYNRIRTMKGAGPTLGLTLVSSLPELGHASKKEIAALVGVAPYTKESGKQRGKSMTMNGRDAIRKVLYMGALTAIRHDKKMREFYNRLRNKGKLKKVCIVAVMRKMIVTLNAMIANSTDYCIDSQHRTD